MSVPRPSLLRRLQQGDQAAWGHFVDLYSPLLFLWAVRAGLQGQEASDFIRSVFSHVAHKLGEFVPGSPGGFRNWIRILAHQQRAELIQRRPAKTPVSPVPPTADTIWQAEYAVLLLGPALEQLQRAFPPAEWKSSWGTAIEGRPPADLARETGTTLAAVRVSEAKMVRRLRQELDGLLD